MKKVKGLTVEVTYRVCLSDINMPDDVYEDIMNKNDICEDDLSYDWLMDNISERDSVENLYSIYELNI